VCPETTFLLKGPAARASRARPVEIRPNKITGWHESVAMRRRLAPVGSGAYREAPTQRVIGGKQPFVTSLPRVVAWLGW